MNHKPSTLAYFSRIRADPQYTVKAREVYVRFGYQYREAMALSKANVVQAQCQPQPALVISHVLARVEY